MGPAQVSTAAANVALASHSWGVEKLAKHSLTFGVPAAAMMGFG